MCKGQWKGEGGRQGTSEVTEEVEGMPTVAHTGCVRGGQRGGEATRRHTHT